MKEFFKGLKKQGVFLLMVLPGALSMLIFFYIPVFGNVVAFKDFRYSPNGFLASIVESKWV
ncbi:MAG TPA: sugar ABC transporter permease, partial [Erysipelothrix sp.]